MSKYRYKDYVCPQCWQKITKCKCKYQSWALIMIDEAIQDAIKILNNKRLKTEYCCAGHYKGEGAYTEIQVQFFKKPNSYPEGWTNRDRNIWYGFEPRNENEFKEIQKREIENLIKWANSNP